MAQSKKAKRELQIKECSGMKFMELVLCNFIINHSYVDEQQLADGILTSGQQVVLAGQQQSVRQESGGERSLYREVSSITRREVIIDEAEANYWESLRSTNIKNVIINNNKIVTCFLEIPVCDCHLTVKHLRCEKCTSNLRLRRVLRRRFPT